MENNEKMRTSAKPNKLYIIRKVLMKAIQNVLFIEFEPLCQKLWPFLKNFGIFTPNMVMSRDPRNKFRNFFFCPNFLFNIRKIHKISSGKVLYFRSYQPKTSQGVKDTPSAFRVKRGLGPTVFD